MAKSKIREIALISLPIVFLGGFGWWANGRQQQRAARENGPYRTRLVSVEDLRLTPFERWQGFDSKVRIVATDDGKPELPAGVKLSDRRSLFGHMFLVAKSGGQFPLDASDVGLRDVYVQGYGARTTGQKKYNALQLFGNSRFRSEQENLATVFLVNSHANGGVTRLKGSLSIQRRLISSPKLAGKRPAVITNFWDSNDVLAFNSRPLQIDRVLRPSNAPIDHQSPKIISSQLIHIRPYDAAGGDDTVVVAELDVSQIRRKSEINWRDVSSHIESENGETVRSARLQGPEIEYGRTTVKYFFKSSSVPAAKGQLTLKTWLSYQDSWPVFLSVVLRERNADLPPRKLKLLSARLIGAPNEPEVEVRVRYTGSQNVEDENQIEKGYHNILAQRRDIPPRKPGTDRLITHWSQHLVYPNGKEQWHPQNVGYSQVRRESKDIIVVTYPLPAMNKWKPGQSAHFRAQIGIEDDGFLDVDLPIVKAK